MRAAPLALAAHVAAADGREAAHSHRDDPRARVAIEEACAELAPARATRGAVRDALSSVRDGAAASELAALIGAAHRHTNEVNAAAGQIHHYTAGAPRSVLESREGSALVSEAFHDLAATELSGSELYAAFSGAIDAMRRAHDRSIRWVCAHTDTLP